eukprot:scaffold8995_cov139-Cylindrotheca_fusiformis.AAC.9
MMIRKVLQTLSLAGCACSFHFTPPVPSMTGGRAFYRQVESKLRAGPVSDESLSASQSKKEEERKSTLTFDIRVEASSKPVPLISHEKLLSFARSKDNRNLLISAGGKRPVKEFEVTPHLLTKWKTACDQLGAKNPDKCDSIVEVRTSGIDLPGLQLESLAVTGIKDVGESQNKTIYEFVLIQHENKVRGLAAVVWIFNKLTGAGETDEKDRQSTSSLSTLSYEAINDSEIVFTCRSQLLVQVNFPSFLLKILPTNKEKAEESGQRSFSKALEKDVAKSMNEFEKAYLNTVF